MAYAYGDVLLVPIPFSDASGVKRRPVLVVYDSDDLDLLVVPITSHPVRTSEDIMLAEWQCAGLRLPSTARMAKLATVAKASVIRPLGKLTPAEGQATRLVLRSFLQKIT